MNLSDNEQCSNSKFQRLNTKLEQNKHGPPIKLEVGSDAIEEWVSSADIIYPLCALCRKHSIQIIDIK